MESIDVDGSLKQIKQQVCKHVMSEREKDTRGMFSYIVRARHYIVFLGKVMIKTLQARHPYVQIITLGGRQIQ